MQRNKKVVEETVRRARRQKGFKGDSICNERHVHLIRD